MTFTRQLIKGPLQREGSEAKVMLTGAKQWGPLPVREPGREDTSYHQVSRDSVLICCLSFVCTCGLGDRQFTHVEVRGQTAGGRPRLLPCVCWGLNLGHQGWWQRPFSSESSLEGLWRVWGVLLALTLAVFGGKIMWSVPLGLFFFFFLLPTDLLFSTSTCSFKPWSTWRSVFSGTGRSFISWNFLIDFLPIWCSPRFPEQVFKITWL